MAENKKKLLTFQNKADYYWDSVPFELGDRKKRSNRKTITSYAVWAEEKKNKVHKKSKIIKTRSKTLWCVAQRKSPLQDFRKSMMVVWLPLMCMAVGHLSCDKIGSPLGGTLVFIVCMKLNEKIK